MDAVELVSLMTAAYLYAVCQGLDLHVLYLEYLSLIEDKAKSAFHETFSRSLPDAIAKAVWDESFTVIQTTLKIAKNQNTPERARTAAEATIVPITKAVIRSAAEENGTDALSALIPWVETLTQIITTSIKDTRTRFASSQGPPTLQYLGHGSAIMYSYVRNSLNVPLHKGLVEHPAYPACSRDGVDIAKTEKLTIGNRISKIYAALRSGQMCAVLVQSLS